MRAFFTRSIALLAFAAAPLLAGAQESVTCPVDTPWYTCATTADAPIIEPGPADGPIDNLFCIGCAWSVDLPWSFPFSGAPKTKAWVSANGVITFTGWDGMYVPGENGVGYLAAMGGIAPLWDDWDMSSGGGVYYGGTAERAVFTWRDVPLYPQFWPTATFQAVLYPDGRIEFRYGPNDTNTTATIGISDTVTYLAWETPRDLPKPAAGQGYVLYPTPSQPTNRAPVVTLAPLPGLTNQNPLPISATATDPDGDALKVYVYRVDSLGGESLVAWGTGPAVSAEVPFLADGAYSILVRAVDPAGASGEDSRQVVFDGTRPTLWVADTPDLTRAASLTVSGETFDANGVASVSVALDGVPQEAPIAADGTFSIALTLPADGPHDLVVSATDRAGNTTAIRRGVTLDTTPPVLEITGPPAVVASSFFDVTFSVTDASPTTATVTVGAFTTTKAVPNDGSPFAVAAQADAEGPATITVAVADAAGNLTTATRSVLVDLSAPILALETAFDGRPIEDGMLLGAASGGVLAFNLVVNDVSATTTLFPDGTTWPLEAGGGVLSGIQQLGEGANALAFTAEDSAGHATTLVRTVTYDATPPSVDVLSPRPSAAVRGVLEWSATAQDALSGIATANVRLDGGAWMPATLASDGLTYTAAFDTSAVADGADHVVECSFVDGAGNAQGAVVQFMVDNTKPTVALSGLPPVVQGTVAVLATASDATSGVASVELSVNGELRQTCAAPAASPCTFDLDTTALLDGSVTLGAVATDAAGNSDAAQLVVTVDNSAPASFLVSPSAGMVVNTSVLVAVNVTDPAFAQVECFVGGTSLGVSTDPQFSQTVSVLDRVDGPLVVSCTALDAWGNAGTQAVTVEVRHWTVVLVPRTLNLRSRGSQVTMTVEGVTVGLLLPVTKTGVALAVPGSAPVPALDHPGSAATHCGNGDGVPEVLLKFDRGALVDAIRAGIAAGLIDPAAPVRVSLVVAGQVSASDTIRIVR